MAGVATLGLPDSPGVTVGAVADTLSALHYLHETTEPEAPEGIVHGDVRPDKIFVTYDGDVRLLHSGIAAAANYAGTNTMKERLAYVVKMILSAARGHCSKARALQVPHYKLAHRRIVVHDQDQRLFRFLGNRMKWLRTRF